MKKFLVFLCLFMAIAAVASAAPLTDFSLGHASLDGNLDLNIVNVNNGGSLNGAAFGTDFGATFGILQQQYGGVAVQTKILNYSGPTSSSAWVSVEKQEYNAIYQLPVSIPVSIQPYVGLDFVNAGLGSKVDSSRGYNYVASYGFHFGIGVDVPFNNNWNAFGNISGGNTFFNVGAGIAYSINNNFDVNAGIKYDNIFVNNMVSSNGNNIGIFTPYVGATLKI